MSREILLGFAEKGKLSEQLTDFPPSRRRLIHGITTPHSVKKKWYGNRCGVFVFGGGYWGTIREEKGNSTELGGRVKVFLLVNLDFLMKVWNFIV